MSKKYKIGQTVGLLFIILMIVLGDLVNVMSLNQVTSLTVHTALLYILKSSKVIGVDLLFIVIANYLIRNPKGKKLSLQLWKKSIMYSITLTLVGFALAIVVFSKQALIQSIFPNLLNSNETITTLILLVFLSPYLNKGLANNDDITLLKINGALFAIFGVAPMVVKLIPTLNKINIETPQLLWAVMIYILVFSWNQLIYDGNKSLLIKTKLSIGAIAILLLLIGLVNKWLSILSGLASVELFLSSQNNLILLLAAFIFWNYVKNFYVISETRAITLLGMYMLADHTLLTTGIGNYVFRITLYDKVAKVLLCGFGLTILIYLTERLVAVIGHNNNGWSSRGWTYFSGLLISLALYTGMTVSNFNYHYLTVVYVNHDKLILNLLNLLLLYMLFLLTVAIFNRLMLSAGLFSLVGVIYIVANQLKITARNEPILPIEFSNIFNIPDLLKIIQPSEAVSLISGILLVIGIIIFCQIKVKGTAIFKWSERIIFVVITTTVFGSLAYLVPEYTPRFSDYHDTAFNNFLRKIQYRPVQTTPSLQMQSNGQIIGLVSMAKVKVMEKPDNYNKREINHIVAKYQKEAALINKSRTGSVGNQTVIYVLSESLANPNRIPGVKLSQNPLSYLDQIKKQNTSGLMDSYGYGGGTANIEFEALTSLSMNNFAPSMSLPYLYLVPKLKQVPTVMDDFEIKNAIHPFTPTIYSRNRVFKKFGFQHFYNLNSKDKLTYTKKIQNSNYISDDSAFKETLKQINRTKKGQFIQLTTMQNHMPYLANDYENTIKVSGDLTKDSRAELATYTQGIQFTDEALHRFINKINKIDKKITVVFYGDHLPSVYQFKTKNDEKSAKYDRLLHQTDFFIYSNYKAPIVSQDKVVSPYMFTPMMLAQTGNKVSPYYSLLTDVWKKAPASERQKLMASNGKYISKKSLDKKTKQIMKDYKMIQYDIVSGNQYTYQTDFYKTK